MRVNSLPPRVSLWMLLTHVIRSEDGKSVSYDSIQTDFYMCVVVLIRVAHETKSCKEVESCASWNESIDVSAFGMLSSERRIEW